MLGQTTVCRKLDLRGRQSREAALKSLGKGMFVATLFATAIYLSTQAAAPNLLPGIALGWEALFHVERASVMLGAIGAVILIAWRALSGEFPIKFGNVEYAAKEAAFDSEEVSESQETRIRLLEALAGLRDPVTFEDDGSRL